MDQGRQNMHRQRGAVLIISLVLLMVLTILAISTMRTASLGLLMAGNNQYRQNAWQLAQAGIDSVLRAGDPALTDSCDTAVADAPVVIDALGGKLELVAQFPNRPPVVIDHLGVESPARPKARTTSRGGRARA